MEISTEVQEISRRDEAVDVRGYSGAHFPSGWPPPLARLDVELSRPPFSCIRLSASTSLQGNASLRSTRLSV